MTWPGSRLEAPACSRSACVRAATVAILTVTVAIVAGGCATLGGTQPSGEAKAGEAKAPTDPMGILRQDVDRLRTEVTELRTLIEASQRSATEHADRAASETRAEID